MKKTQLKQNIPKSVHLVLEQCHGQKKYLQYTYTSFNVDLQQIIVFIHDNASNIELAGRLLKDKYGWYTDGCAGNALQLCIIMYI